jgi:hypothetical protein
VIGPKQLSAFVTDLATSERFCQTERIRYFWKETRSNVKILKNKILNVGVVLTFRLPSTGLRLFSLFKLIIKNCIKNVCFKRMRVEKLVNVCE